MHVTIVAGARPNFIKVAPVIHAINARNQSGDKQIDYCLVHTGQHYDMNMSQTFFRQLGMPEPAINLEARGGSQAEQTAAIMTRFESFLQDHPTDIVLVVGDVTSTLACTIVAKKMAVRVGHIEGGIRSRDWTMPEEINRVVTDSIADFFFTTSEIAGENLKREGVSEESIFFVGNTMIDTLLANMNALVQPIIWSELGLKSHEYLVLTMHRPSNVDNVTKLKKMLALIADRTNGIPVIFPAHPRTRKILEESNMSVANLHVTEPLGYLEFIYLVRYSKAVITDSGGVTEETTVLGVPCLTLRDNTERPETVTIGTNCLIGTDPSALVPALETLFRGEWKKGAIPAKWDGMSAKRILDSLVMLEKKGELQPPVPFLDKSLLYSEQS